MDQIELMQKCRCGNRKAQHELFRLYALSMYHVAWRIVGDSMESEEVAQEAFIKVFARLDQFEGKATLGAWIKRIVINQALNSIRKKKVYTQDIDYPSSDFNGLFEENSSTVTTVLVHKKGNANSAKFVFNTYEGKIDIQKALAR